MSGHSEEIGRDPCGMVGRWSLSPLLASMLLSLDQWACGVFSSKGLGWPGLRIISGYRTRAVVAAFNPTQAAAQKSRHRRIPSLAADLRVGDTPATATPIEVWTFLGLQWERQGGRWGGRFNPPDPNHFDIDPALIGEGFELPGVSRLVP